MKNRIIVAALILGCASAALMGTASAADTGAEGRPAEITITVDGETKVFTRPVFLYNDTTYVSFRELSLLLGAEGVYWKDGEASMLAPDLYIRAQPGQTYIIANNRYLFAPNGILMLDDRVYVPIRLMARAFGYAVEWRADTSEAALTSGGGPIEQGDDFYSEKDVYWMSRIIRAEAGDQPFFGKIAVGNVVMNRVAYPEFPNTVYDVIFDKKNGVQFTPAYSGAIYNTPTTDCVIAAKLALDGGNVAGDSLYFNYSTHCWAGRNRPFTMELGGHYFWA